MKDDLKKYINLAYKLDDLILKSLSYGNKEKLYESFISGQLLFEDANDDNSELSNLKTSGITDTGTSAPYTDVPYTGPTTGTTYNQRQQSNLSKNNSLRRPWGDPYIYYSATSGTFYAYFCGKNPDKSIIPCPQIEARNWKNANKFKTDILSLVFTDAYNTQQSGNQQGENQQSENQQSGNQQVNLEIIKKFRDMFYSTYAWFIAKEYFGNVKVYPTYPTYLTKIEIVTGFEIDAKTYDFDLVNRTVSDGFTLSDDTLNKSIENFIKKTIPIANENYKLANYNSSALSPASKIFEKDGTSYNGDEKVKGLIKDKRLGIYKA